MAPFAAPLVPGADEIVGYPVRMALFTVFVVVSPAMTTNAGKGAALFALALVPVFALALWLGVRLVALWVNMIQNFWSHDRRFGSRIYAEDPDNAVNITEWLPVTATFSAGKRSKTPPQIMNTSGRVLALISWRVS